MVPGRQLSRSKRERGWGPKAGTQLCSVETPISVSLTLGSELRLEGLPGEEVGSRAFPRGLFHLEHLRILGQALECAGGQEWGWGRGKAQTPTVAVLQGRVGSKERVDCREISPEIFQPGQCRGALGRGSGRA